MINPGGGPDLRTIPTVHPPLRETRPSDQLWYVSYGSNMSVDRFLTYVTGGQPPGGNTTHPGCRDRTPPAATTATWLPGQVYFAQHSTTWGGAVAFYDHDQPGPAPAVAYLITAGQLADIVHQEMHRPPGTDLDLTDALTDALTTGRSTLGPGRYETLLTVGQHHGRPQITFTAPWRMADVDPALPSGPYLRTLLHGLCATHHWTLPPCGRPPR